MIVQEKLKEIQVILGSKSPRRKELLASMDITFDVQIKETDESYNEKLNPIEIVKHIAQTKLSAFSEASYEDKLIICADTIVVRDDGRVLGKPMDVDEARNVLVSLSGNSHLVYTAVAIAYKKQNISFVEETRVWMNAISKNEIDYYVEKYQPLDKAGAYGIQEWIGKIGIKKIEGSYENVIGLPTAKLQQELKKLMGLEMS